MPDNRVSVRGTIALGFFAVAFGLVVLLTEGLPDLRDGRSVVGAAITVCAALGIALGVAALIAQARRSRRRF